MRGAHLITLRRSHKTSRCREAQHHLFHGKDAGQSKTNIGTRKPAEKEFSLSAGTFLRKTAFVLRGRRTRGVLYVILAPLIVTPPETFSNSSSVSSRGWLFSTSASSLRSVGSPFFFMGLSPFIIDFVSLRRFSRLLVSRLRLPRPKKEFTK